MAKRDTLVRAYLDHLPARRVSIFVGADGRSIATLFPEPDATAFEVLWFERDLHADLVLTQCPEGWVDRAPSDLRDAVVNAAAALGAPFKTSAEIEADAIKAVTAIVEEVDIKRQSGGLSQVNRDYKLYRKRQLAKGERAIPYSAHLDAFTWRLVVLAAQSSTPR